MAGKTHLAVKEKLFDAIDVRETVLNPFTHVVMYRLFQQTLRFVMEKEMGVSKVDRLFRKAGWQAGFHFFKRFCGSPATVQELFRIVEERFREMGIGIFRVEFCDVEELFFSLTVSEDLDCSGYPDTGKAICMYSEGLLQGLLEAFTGCPFKVHEVECWGTGAQMCRFNARVLR